MSDVRLMTQSTGGHTPTGGKLFQSSEHQRGDPDASRDPGDRSLEGGRTIGGRTRKTAAGPPRPRAQIALSCTLYRRAGAPIVVETIDLGPDGMRVTSRRPLSEDEVLNVELADLAMRVAGRARVLRHERAHVYVLRFERMPEPMTRYLHALAVNAT